MRSRPCPRPIPLSGMLLGPRALLLAAFAVTTPTEANRFGDPSGKCFEKSLAYAETKPQPLQPQGGFVASAQACQISCSGMWWCRYFTWYKEGTPELPTKGACWFFGKNASMRSVDGTIGGPKFSFDCAGIDVTAPSTTPKGGVVPIVPPPVVVPAAPGAGTTEEAMAPAATSTAAPPTSTAAKPTTEAAATTTEEPPATTAAAAAATTAAAAATTEAGALLPRMPGGRGIDVPLPDSITTPGGKGVVVPPVPVVVPVAGGGDKNAAPATTAAALAEEEAASTTAEVLAANATVIIAGEESKKPWWGWILILLGILLLLLAAAIAYFVCLGWAEPSKKKRTRSPLDRLRSGSSVNNSDAEDTSRELLQGQAVQHRELHIAGRQPPMFAGAPMTGGVPPDLFDQIDTNHDGRISQAEFAAANPYGMLLPGTSAAQLGYAALRHAPQVGGPGAGLPPSAGLVQVPTEPVTVVRPPGHPPVSRQSSQPARLPPPGIR